MKYALDASVALKWVLPEDDFDKACALRDDYRAGTLELVAAAIFPAEIGHALARAERRGIIDQGDGSLLLADILTTPPRLEDVLPLMLDAYIIASATGVSFYDCLYVALAERESCEFVTADTRAVQRLQAEHPCVVALNSLR